MTVNAPTKTATDDNKYRAAGLGTRRQCDFFKCFSPVIVVGSHWPVSTHWKRKWRWSSSRLMVTVCSQRTADLVTLAWRTGKFWRRHDDNHPSRSKRPEHHPHDTLPCRRTDIELLHKNNIDNRRRIPNYPRNVGDWPGCRRRGMAGWLHCDVNVRPLACPRLLCHRTRAGTSTTFASNVSAIPLWWGSLLPSLSLVLKWRQCSFRANESSPNWLCWVLCFHTGPSSKHWWRFCWHLAATLTSAIRDPSSDESTSSIGHLEKY